MPSRPSSSTSNSRRALANCRRRSAATQQPLPQAPPPLSCAESRRNKQIEALFQPFCAILIRNLERSSFTTKVQSPITFGEEKWECLCSCVENPAPSGRISSSTASWRLRPIALSLSNVSSFMPPSQLTLRYDLTTRRSIRFTFLVCLVEILMASLFKDPNKISAYRDKRFSWKMQVIVGGGGGGGAFIGGGGGGGAAQICSRCKIRPKLFIQMKKQISSTTMDLSHDIFPRLQPHLYSPIFMVKFSFTGLELNLMLW